LGYLRNRLFIITSSPPHLLLKEKDCLLFYPFKKKHISSIPEFRTFNSKSGWHDYISQNHFRGPKLRSQERDFENAMELRKARPKLKKFLGSVAFAQVWRIQVQRQHPVKEFIIDFYCHRYLLGIEVDGEVHDNDAAKEYDSGRTYELESLGITILRFKNEEVLNNVSKVKAEILHKLDQLRSARNGIPDSPEKLPV
jgi:very-short-patch-repair endonuclease